MVGTLNSCMTVLAYHKSPDVESPAFLQQRQRSSPNKAKHDGAGPACDRMPYSLLALSAGDFCLPPAMGISSDEEPENIYLLNQCLTLCQLEILICSVISLPNKTAPSADGHMSTPRQI